MMMVEMFPAREGDCLILTWGKTNKRHRMLIDAGRKATASAVLEYATKNSFGPDAFELFVVTHIDRDHIEGAVKLLRSAEFQPLVKEVWFNGRGELEYPEPSNRFEAFGALDGERLTSLIEKHEIDWNTRFPGDAIAIPDDGYLPSVTLPGGLVLTLLSPDHDQLAALAKPWDDTLERARPGWEELGEEPSLDELADVKFRSDGAKPNASSIAFVAEFEGHRILFTGDAHVARLRQSLSKYRETNEGPFTLVKASHHGSRGNTSLDLVRELDCSTWLFSTNGDQFRHPDKEAVARVIKGSNKPVHLHFNYKTVYNELWQSGEHSGVHFEVTYGEDGFLTVGLD